MIFLSGTICATNNGASIYIEAKKKPETYLTEKGTPMWQDIVHADIPKGPAAGVIIDNNNINHLVGLRFRAGCPGLARKKC